MNYEQQMTTTAVLELIDSDKSQRRFFVDDLLMRMDGEVNPLKVHVQMKCFEEIIAMCTDANKYPDTAKRYKAMILDEAQKHGKTFEFHSAKIEQKEVGTSYDWTKCEDEKLNTLLEMQADLNRLVKERQEFLKTVPEGGLIITDESTGETRKVYKPSKSSTTAISVSLK